MVWRLTTRATKMNQPTAPPHSQATPPLASSIPERLMASGKVSWTQGAKKQPKPRTPVTARAPRPRPKNNQPRG